jgi:membrane glycosyltransferase
VKEALRGNLRLAALRPGAVIWRLPLPCRRLVLFASVVAMSFVVAALFARRLYVVPCDPVTALGGTLIGVLCVFGHFSWLLCMFGYLGWRFRPRERPAQDAPISTRTALVMPIYNEDVRRVAAGVRQTWLSAKKAGLDAHCDYYILSDSTDEEIKCDEERAIEELRPLFSSGKEGCGRLALIRRSERANYKAGNIANFLRWHGHGYDFMLVLDADSVMLGTCIRRLILRMQEAPRTAIIQSLMSTFRAATPFGQAMQFSANRVGQVFMCGFNWFLGPEALYWGHNALIRIKPFMAYAQLPAYPGKPPFGGRVLSQDVHEAVLLGRAGWDVALDLEEGGSFEEVPSNFISYGQRDQRWCTGDFLNSALVLAPGFRTGQRIWLAYAMSSYSVSLVLVAMMVVGFALAARQATFTIDAAILGWALIYMPITQLSTNVLAFWMRLDRRLPLWRQTVALLVFEVIARLLITPLMVYQHAILVLGILLGKTVHWKSPPRDPEEGISWSLSARVFWAPTLISAVWIPLGFEFAPASLFFSGTILFPWLFSIPLAVLTSDMRLGRRLAETAMFACPHTKEEVRELGPLLPSTGYETATVAARDYPTMAATSQSGERQASSVRQ